jgi:hypothetical protein
LDRELEKGSLRGLSVLLSISIINSLKDFLLSVCVKPFGQLGQRLATMRNLVFLDLGHLGVCLALVLEAGIPSCGSRQFLFDSASKQRLRLTKVGRSASLNNLALSYQLAQYHHQRASSREIRPLFFLGR